MLDSFSTFLKDNLRLSKTAFNLFAIISVIAVPLAFLGSGSADQWPLGTLLGILITILTYCAFLVLVYFQNIARKEDDYRFSILIIALVGLIRGLIFYAIIQRTDIPNQASLIQRVLNSILTTVIWLGLASVVVEVNRRYKRRYRAILSQLLVVNLRNSGNAQAGFAVIAQDLALLQTRLEESYSSIKDSAEDSKAMQSAADEIRDQIETALKPLSRRLWTNSMYEFPQLRFWRLFADAIWNLKYPFYLVFATLAVSAYVNLTITDGIVFSAINGTAGSVAFVIYEGLRRWSIKVFPSAKASINLTFVISVGIFTGSIATVVLRAFGEGGSYYVTVLLAPYASTVVIASSMVALALSDRREILENLSKGARRLTLNTSDSLQSSQAASYIHNSLQSELTALAHEFELVAANPDKHRSESVLEKLDALIRRSMGEDFSNFLESPQMRLQRVVDSWSSLVELNPQIDLSLFNDPARGNLFVQLIEESLANAVRKGKATSISISAVLAGSRLLVEITDNGTFAEGSSAGIGSAWIERYAVGEWSYTTGHSQTVLKVEL